jgi:precorrin-2 dehydrogenase/sirohydrochlorin ferrochelatase
MALTYPVSLVIKDRMALVVGGGTVAARKVEGLLAASAQVRVVAPQICPELAALVETGLCAWDERPYETTDLANAQLVLAATDDSAINAQLAHDSTERGIWVNVADCPELCTFYLPSLLRRGELSIAVSTGGLSPLTARHIREELETHYGKELGSYVALLGAWRQRVINTLATEKDRHLFWETVSTSEVQALVSTGQREEAERLLDTLLTAQKLSSNSG